MYELQQEQLENIGGYSKIFPISKKILKDEKTLFTQRIAPQASAYYERFGLKVYNKVNVMSTTM